MADLERLAYAIQLFHEFQANPRPREPWLRAHSEHRDLLEALLADADGVDGSPTLAKQRAEHGLALEKEAAASPGQVRIQRNATSGAVEQLGPYRVVEVLGEGGMGTVYLAEQSEPIRRRVALKVIRVGMETGNLVARFEAEREALARMDHPCIAKVLEAGSTSDRCPYLVMEYVAGSRLIHYCDQHTFSLRERVALMAQVCDGVQHAHQKGVIHRDIKPSNVLVTEIDGKVTPKIIDFGIAKAVGEDWEGRSLLQTRTGGIVGTPSYMSPEQLEPGEEPIDTRTDIYSLGVLLYELLVGKLPFDLESDSARGFAELCRVIRHVDPPRPSTRISRLGDTAAAAAADRSANVRSWQRALQRELDWIVLRCLEKDRTRRYESASGLAADLRRYLADEPVLARPPSNLYRFGKVVRRNRGLVTACLIVLASLIVGLGWALVEKSRADRKASELSAQVYRANLLVAANAIADGRVSSARQFLDEAPLEARDWEWRHLEAQLERSLGRVPVPAGLRHGMVPVPGGRAFVGARTDGMIFHCDLDSGEVLRSVRAPGVPIQFHVRRDGREVAVLGQGEVGRGTPSWVATWRLAEGAHLEVIELDPSLSMHNWGEVDADRRRAVLALEHALVLFDLDRREVIARREFDGRVPTPAFVPGGSHLVLYDFANFQRMGVVDAATLQDLGRLSGHAEVTDLAVEPTGTRLAAVSQDGTLKVWSLAGELGTDRTIEPLLRVLTGQERLEHVIYSADGTHLITSGADRSLAIWQASTGERLDRFAVDEVSADLLAMPGARGFASVHASGLLRTWGIEEQDPTVLRGHESFVYAVDVDLARGLILTGGWDGFIQRPGPFRLWDLRSGDPVAVWGDDDLWCYEAMFLPGQDALLTLGTSHPSDRRLHDWSHERQRITRVDLANGASRTLFEIQGHVLSWCASRGQPLVWLATERDGLQRLDLRSGQVTSLESPVNAQRLALTEDDRTIAMVEGGRRLVICRTADLAVIHDLPTDAGSVTSLDFDRRGERLVASSEDGVVRVWDLRTGESVARLVGHDQGVLCARFNPAGTRIATGGRDKTVRIWNGESYQPLVSLIGHERYVYQVTWQDDGERLFSASGDGTVRIWETDPVARRHQARRQRRELVERLAPRVDAWLAGRDGPPVPVEEFLSDEELTEQERPVARQILLGRILGTVP